MTAVVIAGLVVIGVGLLLVLAGLGMIWAEFRNAQNLGGTSDLVGKLADLIRALAGQPRSTVLFSFGFLLIFLGGVIAGVGGLTA